jgi:tryptophan 2,3-dioxygenase
MDTGAVPTAAVAPRSWHDYVADPGLVVEFLTALPQTTHHDEVAFLRTIHLSESCFWGMLVSIMATMDSLTQGAADDAAAALDEAVSFADTLGLALQVLQTMAPGAFLDFGGLTGDASGLQSRAYQLVQIFVFGVDAEKVAILGMIPELRDLLFYANPRFVPLGQALRQAHERGGEDGEVIAAARRLDAAMYQWRSRHKGVATHYLPDDVLTGAAGRDYLASHYRHRLFAHDGTLEKAPGDLLVRPVEGIHARPVLTPTN